MKIDSTILEEADRIRKLIQKLLEGSLADDEHQQLNDWAELSEDNKQFLQKITDEVAFETEMKSYGEDMSFLENNKTTVLPWQRKEEILTQAIHQNEPESAFNDRQVVPLRRWWAVAAIVLVATVGIYQWVSVKKNAGPVDGQEQANIVPGRDGAMLTLADGSQLLLDTINNREIASQGTPIADVKNGILVYKGAGDDAGYNTMTVPNGRQYHLILSDRTEVWLNSASSIRYPTVFTKEVRDVEITGEAYFEVAPVADMPFKVSVNHKAEIAVLGTSFNVNAYEEEEGISTTLIAGSVRVTGNKENAILKPGQQALLNNSLSVVQSPPSGNVIAWKNGLISFDGLPLLIAMRQLERWYDIKIVYEKEIPAIKFFGSMSRNTPFETVLKYLEKSGIHYTLQGRQLLIHSH